MSGLFRDPVSDKPSMTRLVALLLTLCASGLTGALCYYLTRREPEASVVAAVGAVMGALVASGCVAIINRTKATDGDT